MTLFGPDPVDDELRRVLQRLEEGRLPAGERWESRHVDLKEEPDRRDRAGRLVPPPSTRGEAFRKLAGEAVCMANTLGGGALVVGAADDGSLVGATLDPEQLKLRIYELTQQRLTVTVHPVVVGGVHLLVVRCPEAIVPIMWGQRYHHRIDDRCVEVDASTLEWLRRSRAGYDWSGQASSLTEADVRASAVERARDFLRRDGSPRSLDVARARDGDLLRRLNVVTGDGRLTNAGALAFVGRGVPAIDYVHRPAAGADSDIRVNSGGRGLVEELFDVDVSLGLAIPVHHIDLGLVHRQERAIPLRAAREAVVNGVAHRDWNASEPTTVEHLPRRLVVTSPGGFVGGVTSDNIITHPSQPRNRALTELLAALRIAEREGVGVDRMFADMLAVGQAVPEITEVPGPFVRAALVGMRPDRAWMAFLQVLGPSAADLDVLMLVRRLVDAWWVDAATAAPLLQRGEAETRQVLQEVAEITVEGAPLVAPVDGVPASAEPAWRVTQQALRVLNRLDAASGTLPPRPQPTRQQVATDYVRARGRLSSTELASVVGGQPTNLQPLLRSLEDEGVITPGRENRRGAGFYYLRA